MKISLDSSALIPALGFRLKTSIDRSRRPTCRALLRLGERADIDLAITTIVAAEIGYGLGPEARNALGRLIMLNFDLLASRIAAKMPYMDGKAVERDKACVKMDAFIAAASASAGCTHLCTYDPKMARFVAMANSAGGYHMRLVTPDDLVRQMELDV